MRNKYLKKILTLFLLFVFLTSHYCFISANADVGSIYHGYAQKTDNIDRDGKKIFTGDVENFGAERKDFINMTVSQVLSSGYTTSGDEFFAEVTSDVLGNKGIILPAGTIAHGTVRTIQDAKRVSRDGWIEMTFDYLITPDGREIPIEGHISTKPTVATEIAKGVGKGTVHTVGGGIAGGFFALNLLGLEAAIASHGYTILGGAAIGGTIGLCVFLFKKGKGAMLTPGDEIKVHLVSKVALPVLTEDAFKQDEMSYDGLNVKIESFTLGKDPFGEKNTYNFKLTIDNQTTKTFSSMDIAMVSEANKVFYPSVFAENSIMFKTIKPHDKMQGNLAFSVDNPKSRHWLVFYDKQTRKPLVRISIDNLKRKIAIDNHNKKKKRK